MNAIAKSLSISNINKDNDDDIPVEYWHSTSVENLVIDETADRAAISIRVERFCDGARDRIVFFYTAYRERGIVKTSGLTGCSLKVRLDRMIDFHEAIESIRLMVQAYSPTEEQGSNEPDLSILTVGGRKRKRKE